jgi:hypothetical protein
MMSACQEMLDHVGVHPLSSAHDDDDDDLPAVLSLLLNLLDVPPLLDVAAKMNSDKFA